METIAIKNQLIKNLEEAFPGIIIDVELLPQGDRFAGVLIWDGFEEKDPSERQQMIWSVIKSKLGPRAQFISTLIPRTKAESPTEDDD